MSVSLYYSARRDTPLSPVELAAVDQLVASHSIADHVEQAAQTGEGHNGEDFAVYERPSPGVVFEGATKLPSNDDGAMWGLVQHWLGLLAAIRHALPGADWHVHIDDHDVAWDDVRDEYDPSA